nr:interferon-induced very large GTPase 1-like [Paramormyrops kingsleyae]
MESSQEIQSGTKQKRNESFEETQKNLRKALDELKNLLKEGKDQNDPMVKDTEDRIRVALDVPKESWAQGQTLKDLIENIYSKLNVLESSSFSLENISDEDVLKSASGGLCLQGVYKTGNLKDLLETRQQLIEIPESFSLCGPEQSFALPFLVPNPCTEDLEFPLWPLRHIKKSWKSMTSADNPGKYQTRQMFSTPVAVVSFLRLGTSFTSKSQILNSVISKQRHNVFFNRHCKGSAPNSKLMNGVVEIAWYCPGGKKDDIFDDCVAFLNLHGEAKEHRQQLQFLQAVSTVNVLLLSEQPQDEETKTICQNLSQSPVPLICLFSGSERVQDSKNPLKVRLAAKNRNEAELTEELITNIKQCITKSHKKQSIDNCSKEARKLKFKVDEDKQSFKDGHALAQTLVCLLKEKLISDFKKEFLPLHGELWHNWCLKNKQQYRLSCKTNVSIEQQQSVIVSDMKATRQKQRKTALPLNDFMRSFLDCLTSSGHSEDTKFYMLQWLRVLLDELTSDHLARLEENYHLTWSQMRNVPKTKEKAEESDMIRKQLNSISEKMAASTIGLQHIMREVGQMYECSDEQSVAALPAIGAEMLISGYPLELMDGDESHVPLIWVQAVLKSLIDKLGDKKVYVLSILGLQSSGKSTLLNTMFGLQFTVSAGRCTRGAFMQMIKVDEKIREEFGFDFLLVVDTEGLRSPKKEQYFQMFQNYCKGANSVTIFAEFLSKNILSAAEEAIYNRICLDIVNIMKCNNPAFSGNRCNIENHILRNLADQEEFQSCKKYILNPKMYLKSFIGEHWAQCPFCKAICTNTICDHSDDHTMQFHRSPALGNWHYHETDEFLIDFCSTKISSDDSFMIHPDKKNDPL